MSNEQEQQAAVDPMLLDELPDALLTTRDERIDWANAAAARMLGVPREQVIGRSLTEVLAAGELDRLRAVERERDDGWDVLATLRVRFVRLSEPVEVPADLRFGSTPSAGGRRRVFSARSAAEAIRAEALMSRLALLSAKAGSLLDVDGLLDAAGQVFDELGWGVAQIEVRDQTATVRRLVASRLRGPIVEYARSLLGVTASFERFPVIGQVVKTGRALFLDDIPAAMAGFPAGQQTTQLSSSMARARVSRSVWAPVWVDDRPGQVLVVVGPNLTEHDFVAIQLFAAQVATTSRLQNLRGELVRRERLAAVGEMSAVLAHEVRNPIGVLFNSVAGLERFCATSGAPDEPKVLLSIIREESERLQRLVNDMLDFARPVQPRLEAVPLARILEEALEAARQDASFAANRPQVDLALDPDLPAAQVDPELVRRAMVNMLINAFQHVPAGGRVQLSASSQGAAVRVRLANDGRPIATEVAARVFEPFFTTRAAGSGLGLAVVRRIVESLHGRVELEPGTSGVAFSIWLPASAPATAR